MNFTRLPVTGAWRVDVELREDSRGSFTRAFCEHEFRDHGLHAHIAQASTSYSRRAGTLRGLHYQLPPAAEVKMVRVLRGVIWDVVLDLRADSPTYLKWHAEELSAANRSMMYVPQGVAHGFISLVDDVEMLYLMTHRHDPPSERGVRWDDPAVGIAWPSRPVSMSVRDETWPDLDDGFHGLSLLRGLG